MTRILAPASLALAALLSLAPANAQQASQPAGVVATTNNPNLAVATLRLENGARASKIIGAAVYTEAGEKVGTVDDLILTDGNKATMAIVSIGGFLGVGSKLVAFPFDQLRREPDKVTLPGATKDTLAAMPGFTY